MHVYGDKADRVYLETGMPPVEERSTPRSGKWVSFSFGWSIFFGQVMP
mgnify:CR=1 FL=1